MKLKLLPPLLICAVALLAGDQGASATVPVRAGKLPLPKKKKKKKAPPAKTKKPAPAKSTSPGAAKGSKKTPPVHKKSTRRRLKTCVDNKTPSREKCLSRSYIDGPCFSKFRATCQPFIEEELEKDYLARPQATTKMLRPKRSDIPKDLREGKVIPYTGPKPGKSARSTGKNVFARSGLNSVPSEVPSSTAKNVHRNKSWDNNGQKIATCEEYAYEQLYDYMRFLDAAGACKGSKQCVFEVAYVAGNPGVSDRTLKRRDGKPLKHFHQYKLLTQKYPKNLFYALGPKFVYSGAGKNTVKPTASLAAMASAQKAGEEYYKFFCKFGTCGTHDYKNEWAWHKAMNSKNKIAKKMSRAEFEEYDRRRAKLQRLFEEWGVAVKKEKDEILSKVPKDFHRWEDPFTHVGDPLQELHILRELDKSSSKAARELIRTAPAGFIKQIKSMGGGINTRPVQPQQQHGALEPSFTDVEEFAAVGVLAAPKTKKKLPKSKHKPLPPKSSAATKTCSKKHFGNKISELMGVGPISCKIGRLMRSEWTRKQRGQVSCLDLGRTECDWSPTLFEQRVLRAMPVAPDLQKHEKYCRDWLPSGKFPSPIPTNLTKAEKLLFEIYANYQMAMKKLGPYDQGQGKAGKKFGTTIKDADHFGDKDWFAAGYDYDLGWMVEPTKRNGDTEICQLGGEARGGFGADAWVIGEDVEIADGLLRGRVNHNGSNQSNIKAHLRVFRINMFSPVNETFSHSWTTTAAKMYSVPKPKPSFVVWAGPVPITGAGWGELMAGTDVTIGGKLNSNCGKPENISFGVSGEIEPFISVNGRAQVGVGISGVVSAGIRGMLNLVKIGLPVDVGLLKKNRKSTSTGAQLAALTFDMGMGLSLATLSGYISLYVEFLVFEEEWKLFGWNGLGPEKISLMGPVEATLFLNGM